MPNQSFFRKNIKILQDRDPLLSSRILKVSNDSPYEVIRSDGDVANVLVMRGRDVVVFYDNNDPMGYCRKYLESLNLRYAPIIAFCGNTLSSRSIFQRIKRKSPDKRNFYF